MEKIKFITDLKKDDQITLLTDRYKSVVIECQAYIDMLSIMKEEVVELKNKIKYLEGNSNIDKLLK